MAIDKFTKDMDIIAALDNEPNDTGGLTAEQLKGKFDEGGKAIKAYLNETVAPAIDRQEADAAALKEVKHTHSNKALLDTYAQTEENLADAVAKKHSHHNKAVLDGIAAVTQELGAASDRVPSEAAVSNAIAMSGNLPAGGVAGQVLVKKSDASYDMQWDTLTAERVGASPSGHTHTASDIGAAASDHTHTASDVGALSTNGTAAAATKLATARTIITNLASTSTASFNGTANVTPGVTGTLPVANGGTGHTSISALVTTLANNGVSRIATGSYTGTGSGTNAGAPTLSFSFNPKFVFVMSLTRVDLGECGYFLRDIGGYVHIGSSFDIPNIVWGNKTLHYYDSDYSEEYSLNSSGVKYGYVAFG